MLLTESEFKATMASKFLNVTNTAETADPEGFDDYIAGNLVEELGEMQILEIYDAEDQSIRHVIFSTAMKNVHYITVIKLPSEEILGHYIMDLNGEYGLAWEKPAPNQ